MPTIEKIIVSEILDNLSNKFDAFFSEQHLVFEFAQELKNKCPSANIIFEYPYEDSINRFEIDLVASLMNDKYVFEFKYRTKESSNPINIFGIPHLLKNQGACDFGCFDCWADIERNEYLIKEGNFSKNSFFIFITNDNCYFDGKTSTGRSVKYKIFNDFLITGGLKKKILKLSGSPTKISIGIQRYNHNLRALREIHLDNKYLLQYEPFGTKGFKYLLLDGLNTVDGKGVKNEK